MNSPFRLKVHPLPLLLATMVALAMATAAGCSRLDELTNLPPAGTTAGTLLGDKAVASKVRAALLGNAALRNFDITVSAVNGDVRLSGLVDTQSRIDQAIKLARSVDGVHTIHDELRIVRWGGIAVPTGTFVHTHVFRRT